MDLYTDRNKLKTKFKMVFESFIQTFTLLSIAVDAYQDPPQLLDGKYLK